MSKKERHLIHLALRCANDIFSLKPLIDPRVDEGRQLDPVAVQIWQEANESIGRRREFEPLRMPSTEFVILCMTKALGEAA